jgi:hypothetical protein
MGWDDGDIHKRERERAERVETRLGKESGHDHQGAKGEKGEKVYHVGLKQNCLCVFQSAL